MARLGLLGPLALVALVVPKCPLCLAAQLALLGVGAGFAAEAAAWLAPVALALICAAGALVARGALARAQ